MPFKYATISLLCLISLIKIGNATSGEIPAILSDFLSSGPCGWDLPLKLTTKCKHDVDLYRDQICTPTVSSLDNLWAYKSLFQYNNFMIHIRIIVLYLSV